MKGFTLISFLAAVTLLSINVVALPQIASQTPVQSPIGQLPPVNGSVTPIPSQTIPPGSGLPIATPPPTPLPPKKIPPKGPPPNAKAPQNKAPPQVAPGKSSAVLPTPSTTVPPGKGVAKQTPLPPKKVPPKGPPPNAKAPQNKAPPQVAPGKSSSALPTPSQTIPPANGVPKQTPPPNPVPPKQVAPKNPPPNAQVPPKNPPGQVTPPIGKTSPILQPTPPVGKAPPKQTPPNNSIVQPVPSITPTPLPKNPQPNLPVPPPNNPVPIQPSPVPGTPTPPVQTNPGLINAPNFPVGQLTPGVVLMTAILAAAPFFLTGLLTTNRTAPVNSPPPPPPPNVMNVLNTFSTEDQATAIQQVATFMELTAQQLRNLGNET